MIEKQNKQLYETARKIEESKIRKIIIQKQEAEKRKGKLIIHKSVQPEKLLEQEQPKEIIIEKPKLAASLSEKSLWKELQNLKNESHDETIMRMQRAREFKRKLILEKHEQISNFLKKKKKATINYQCSLRNIMVVRNKSKGTTYNNVSRLLKVSTPDNKLLKGTINELNNKLKLGLTIPASPKNKQTNDIQPQL